MKTSSKILCSAAALLAIGHYMEKQAYSYDDRRRALSLFSQHGAVADEFAAELARDKEKTGLVSTYLARIFHTDQA